MKILLIYRFSRMLVEKGSGVFSSLKSVNNRLTRHSRSGKHGRLGHVIETREPVTRSLVEKYTSDF